MAKQKNMSLTQSLKNSRERGLHAAYAKGAAQRQQHAAEEAEGRTGKYGNASGTRRPGRIDEVPPHCYREPFMTDDEATVVAVKAMNITHPLDVILMFFALRAGGSNPTASAANSSKHRKKKHFAS